MKVSSRKRLKMVEEFLEFVDEHHLKVQVEMSVYTNHSVHTVNNAKKLFGKRLRRYYDHSGDSHWIRLHNNFKANDYLGANLCFTIFYPRGKGGDEK